MPAVIFAGTKVKALKKILDLKDGIQIISSTVDPTSVAVNAPLGSILVNESTGDVYKKADSGSSTNWVPLGGSQISIGSRGSPRTITTAGLTVALGHLSGVKYALQKIYLQGSGGELDITAVPQIQAGTLDGQQLQLVGRDDANTVLFQDGDGLSLNGDASLGEDMTLTLSWDGTNWVEVNRNF